MESSRINLFVTALMTTMTIAIVVQPNLIEEKIANNSPSILSSLNIK